MGARKGIVMRKTMKELEKEAVATMRKNRNVTTGLLGLGDREDAKASARYKKRVTDNVCAACRKSLLKGHRVMAAYILVDPRATNPNRIGERGLELDMEHEFVHVRCGDPFLDGRRTG